MIRTIRRLTPLLPLLLIFLSGPVSARVYKNARGYECDPPVLKSTKPTSETTVAPGSEFSFAIVGGKPSTLKVTVKGIPVEVETTKPRYRKFRAKGRLPESLRDEHAKILVKVGTQTGCNLRKGWLVKIGGTAEGASPEAAKTEPEVPEATTPAIKTEPVAPEATTPKAVETEPAGPEATTP